MNKVLILGGTRFFVKMSRGSLAVGREVSDHSRHSW